MEDLDLCSEREHSTQGWVPLRIIRPEIGAKERFGAPPETAERRPVVIFLHPTGEILDSSSVKLGKQRSIRSSSLAGSNMDSLRIKQEEYARIGYVTAAMDCRSVTVVARKIIEQLENLQSYLTYNLSLSLRWSQVPRLQGEPGPGAVGPPDIRGSFGQGLA